MGSTAFARPSNSPLAGSASASRPITFQERDIDDKSAPQTPLTLIQADINGGFAFGVNRGLEVLLADDSIDIFWLLNPDCAVPLLTPSRLVAAAERGPFSMIGLRQVFYEHPDVIQTDAFRLNRHTGVCVSINAWQRLTDTAAPDETSIDFVSGATMAVSRAFIERAGLMEEDYFLYYEEPAWAMRKGDLPVRLADAIVYHHGGTSIGTGTPSRNSSSFSCYFNHRNRIKFVRRHLPEKLHFARLHGIAKAAQLLLKFSPREAWALLAGTFELAPPASVSSRIVHPKARKLAFGRRA